METHEQLAAMSTALEGAGWVRLNGNLWEHPEGQWRVQTAYTHREATVTLLFKGAHGGWLPAQGKPYRGSDPWGWYEIMRPLLLAGKVPTKNFAK